MATVQISRGTATAFTWTSLNSLASSTTAGCQSAAVDDSSTKALDYLITLKTVFPASAPANDKNVYLYAAAFDGANWSGGASGTDTTYTFSDITLTPSSLTFLRALYMENGATKTWGPFSLANAFGGIVPVKFSLVAINYSGQTLSTGCTATYQAINATIG